jgi:serine/threonine-protein kinase RsbW
MRRGEKSRILARTKSVDFIGRTAEIERLLDHANDKSGSNGLSLLAVPSAGTGELLRHVYDHLFVKKQDLIPFYFEIKASDGSAQNAAQRFLLEFLLQTIAFRRRDPNVLNILPMIDEIAELAPPSDGYWIDRLIETYQSDRNTTNERGFVRNCLGAPLRAAANDARVFVMIDGLHAAARLNGGEAFVDDIIDVFSRASIPFVLAGQRRFLYARTPFETMTVEPLSFADAGALIESLSVRNGVAINDQTRDLIAVQLGGNVTYITHLFASAANALDNLKTFDAVEQVYTDEIFGGRIANDLDRVFGSLFPATAQQNILRLLAQNVNADDGKIPIEYWRKHSDLNGVDLDNAIKGLHCAEMVNLISNSIAVDPSNNVLRDYLHGRVRLEIDGEPRALVVGEAVSENVKRAPQLMARFYRRNSSLGLREMLLSFDGRKVSPVLLDYGYFKDELKGSPEDKIIKAVKEDNAKISLPQIVFTAHTGDFYSKLNELCAIESSAVALGFTYTGKIHGTAWIAAEIDSKLEAERELVEFWCDRLEMAAVHCNFEQFKVWLIAPEGFTPEAMDALRARDAYGSSRKQVELLSVILGAEISTLKVQAGNEYEFVFPMGENTEMIAAQTVEEIARRHAFPPKAINQIKTALVEACINAAEHSLSPDRKIYQRFVVDPNKITITVSNRGVRLADKATEENVSDKGRRGWGLKLIKGLMDEVSIDQVDDGTRITMVKRLKRA